MHERHSHTQNLLLAFDSTYAVSVFVMPPRRWKLGILQQFAEAPAAEAEFLERLRLQRLLHTRPKAKAKAKTKVKAQARPRRALSHGVDGSLLVRSQVDSSSTSSSSSSSSSSTTSSSSSSSTNVIVVHDEIDD